MNIYTLDEQVAFLKETLAEFSDSFKELKDQETMLSLDCCWCMLNDCWFECPDLRPFIEKLTGNLASAREITSQYWDEYLRKNKMAARYFDDPDES